ncbi:MAG: glycine cleavage system aminomethyltransferase GcvT [Opitutales bacterium]
MQGIVGESGYASKPRTLVLHALHEALGARFTSFAGWEMPVAYGSSVEEHLACRRQAAVFDVSHMGEIEVKGSDAGSFLDYAATNLVSSAELGQAVYSPMCVEDGGVLDDLIACKRAEDDYLLCVNAANITVDFAHLCDLSAGYSCEVFDVSSAYGQLAVQGPEAVAIVAEVSGVDPSIGRMRFVETEVFGSPVILACSGYTGEDGFEIYCQTEVLQDWADTLIEVGKSRGLRWAGLAARDGLRLEAGFPLHGHELSGQITPIQACLGWSVKWDKPEGFVGRDALLREKEQGPSGRLGHYVVEDRRIPREGAAVAFGGVEVGHVTSGGYSPLLGKPIGSAWIRAESCSNRKEQGWAADVRGQLVPITFGKPPLQLFRAHE